MSGHKSECLRRVFRAERAQFGNWHGTGFIVFPWKIGGGSLGLNRAQRDSRAVDQQWAWFVHGISLLFSTATWLYIYQIEQRPFSPVLKSVLSPKKRDWEEAGPLCYIPSQSLWQSVPDSSLWAPGLMRQLTVFSLCCRNLLRRCSQISLSLSQICLFLAPVTKPFGGDCLHILCCTKMAKTVSVPGK